MNKAKIVEALNQARTEELGAILQYMGHHYEAEGLESPAIIDEFKKAAMDEMKHAEALAERIVYLGGEPTKVPAPIEKGGNLKKMIQDDLAAENEAIGKYRKRIKLSADEGDYVTRRLLEGILADEEEHANTWKTALGIRK